MEGKQSHREHSGGKLKVVLHEEGTMKQRPKGNKDSAMQPGVCWESRGGKSIPGGRGQERPRGRDLHGSLGAKDLDGVFL